MKDGTMAEGWKPGREPSRIVSDETLRGLNNENTKVENFGNVTVDKSIVEFCLENAQLTVTI